MTRTKISLKLGIRRVTQAGILDSLQMHSPCTRLRISVLTTWRDLGNVRRITKAEKYRVLSRPCLHGTGTVTRNGDWYWSFSLCAQISNTEKQYHPLQVPRISINIISSNLFNVPNQESARCPILQAMKFHQTWSWSQWPPYVENRKHCHLSNKFHHLNL
jgi:hypothetical protein